MDIDALCLIIRSKITDGRLPRNGTERVWGARGTGEICDACDTPITKDEFIIEGVYLHCTLEDAALALLLHARCFWLWDSERRQMGVD
jgi:hypothetical protein